MAITDADILTYLRENRLSEEAQSYLYINKVNTLGRDEISSARLWLQGRFISVGRVDEYTTWKTLIYGLDSTDLTNLESIESALEAAGSTDSELHTMLFDSMINIARARIFSVNGQFGSADQFMDDAQEIIGSLIGKNADPSMVNDSGGVPDAYASIPTSDEDEELIGKY